MAVVSRHISAPATGLFRVAKDVDPFTFWPPRSALPTSEPVWDGNRFDDPFASFASVYCATDPVAAFGETIARYRTAEGLMDRIEGFLAGEPDSEFDPPLSPGAVPADYFAGRYIGNAQVDPAVVFVDLERANKVTRSHPALAEAARLLGVAI